MHRPQSVPFQDKSHHFNVQMNNQNGHVTNYWTMDLQSDCGQIAYSLMWTARVSEWVNGDVVVCTNEIYCTERMLLPYINTSLAPLYGLDRMSPMSTEKAELIKQNA